MTRKATFSGKKIKVFHLQFPIALARVDSAVVITPDEEDFDEPVIDMDGDGTHVENTSESGKIKILVDPSSTSSIQYLQAVRVAKTAAAFMAGRDMATQNSSFSVNNVVLKKAPDWVGGKRPVNLEYTFSYINGTYIMDGPRILPV